MATELEIRERLDMMRSLPTRWERLAGSIGTTIWPGQPMRLDLPTGMELTDRDREEIQIEMDQRNQIITGSNLTAAQSAKARLSLLTKMLLAKAVSGSLSVEAAAARREMYEETLSDIPPWAIDAAIKRWNRGEVPDLKMGALNFAYAPDSAVLRALCKLELAPFEAQVVKLKRLLLAIPVARAMDPTPLPTPEVKSDGGNVVKIGVRKM